MYRSSTTDAEKCHFNYRSVSGIRFERDVFQVSAKEDAFMNSDLLY